MIIKMSKRATSYAAAGRITAVIVIILNAKADRHIAPHRLKELIAMIDRIALVLVIIGALNWGSIGIFSFDIVGWAFGGQAAAVSRIIFTLVGIAGIWCISLLFRDREVVESRHTT